MKKKVTKVIEIQGEKYNVSEDVAALIAGIDEMSRALYEKLGEIDSTLMVMNTALSSSK